MLIRDVQPDPTIEANIHNPALMKGLHEIELAQLKRLHDHDSHPKRYWERLGQGIHEQLLEGTPAEKAQFLAYLPFSIWQRFWNAVLVVRRVMFPVPEPVRAAGDGPFRVAISMMGSLGDFMHQVPFMQAFYSKFAPMEVDFFVHHLKLDDRSKLAVSGLPFVRQILDIAQLSGLFHDESYHLHIEIRHVIKYHMLRRTKVVQEKPGLLALIDEADKRFEPYRFIFEHHPKFDGLFGKLMAERGMNAVEASGYFGNLPISRDADVPFAPPLSALQSLKRFGFLDKPFITIHDGFEQDHRIADTNIRATRSWPLQHWQEFVSEFKALCPEILVIQIGISKTAGAIAGVDVSLVDRATLSEACWAIKHALLHVDSEAGLVRVASAWKTPSISIQGPSATEFFHFAHSQPVKSEFCRGCYWVNYDWMTRCLRGFSRAECMHAISPNLVAKTAAEVVTAATAGGRRESISEAAEVAAEAGLR